MVGSFSLLKILFPSFFLHASYVPIMPNSSPCLERISVSSYFWSLYREYILCPEAFFFRSACQEPINTLRASSSISFTVETFLPLFHCTTFTEFLVFLCSCRIVYTPLLQYLLHRLIYQVSKYIYIRYLVYQNRDLVIFEFLAQYLTCSLKHNFSVNVCRCKKNFSESWKPGPETGGSQFMTKGLVTSLERRALP